MYPLLASLSLSSHSTCAAMYVCWSPIFLTNQGAAFPSWGPLDWRRLDELTGLWWCWPFYRKDQFWGRRVWVLIPSSRTIFNVIQVLVTRQVFYKAHLNKHWWKHVLWSSAFPWAIERWHSCNIILSDKLGKLFLSQKRLNHHVPFNLPQVSCVGLIWTGGWKVRDCVMIPKVIFFLIAVLL